MDERVSGAPISRPSGSVSRPSTGGTDEQNTGDPAQANAAHTERVTVDQPPLAVGVRFPLCPPNTNDPEQNDEASHADSATDGGGRPSSLVPSVDLPKRRPWLKGDDGFFHPTPPYREGEIVACEGCDRPVRVSASVARYQFVYNECRSCADDYDGWMARMESEA